MNDAQLLSEFREAAGGDAFGRIVGRHGPMVLRVCRDILGDEHAAEDAFQTTFLTLARRADRIRDPDVLGRWLYGVARRVAVRERVRGRRRGALVRDGLPMEVLPMPEGSDDRSIREARPILHEEVGRLPGGVRDAILLCHMEGLTQEAAAASLGCPLGTLKSRLARGRELLRGRLKRRGVALSAALLYFLLTEEAPAVPLELAQATRRRASKVTPGMGSHPVRWPRKSWLALVGLAVILSSGAVALARWNPPSRPPRVLTIASPPIPGPEGEAAAGSCHAP
ncbi:MAG: sigma-70 family RNA polymerase sigma factor [Isosphaeraceae bacterium]